LKNIFVFKTAGWFHFGHEIDQAELYYRDFYGSGVKPCFREIQSISRP